MKLAGPWLVALLAAAVLSPLAIEGAQAEAKPVAVVDLHVDLSYQHTYKGRSFEKGTGQFVLRSLRQAGLVGVVLPLYVPKQVSVEGPREVDLEHSYERIFGKLITSDFWAPPGCVKAGADARVWLAFEGAAPLAKKPELVARWMMRGVRIFGLVHSYDNPLATSSTGRRGNQQGLSADGIALVEEIHRHGGMVDISHASDRAASQVIESARKAGAAVVATHSNARQLVAHPRNLSDELIRGIASTGGVVGVNFHSPYLRRRGRATMADVAGHIRYVVDLVGAEHVAIGSDFEGGIRPPKGLDDALGYQRLATALRDSGLSQRETQLIFSQNALRLLCPSRAR